jgi:hypothetical protein
MTLPLHRRPDLPEVMALKRAQKIPTPNPAFRQVSLLAACAGRGAPAEYDGIFESLARLAWRPSPIRRSALAVLDPDRSCSQDHDDRDMGIRFPGTGAGDVGS